MHTWKKIYSVYYNSCTYLYLGKSCPHPANLCNSMGVETNSIWKKTTGDRSHCFDGFPDGSLNAVLPVHYGHDTCHSRQNNNCICYHLSSGLPSVQHGASTVHNAALNTERRIRVPETETEGQEKCWSGTESKGTEKLLWLPNPRPQTA